MSRQTVNPTLLRLGLIAVMAISLIVGFGGAQPALADPISPLAVTKTANPSPVASGAEITYTITMVNTGGSKVDNVVMTDQLNGVGGIGAPPQLVLTSYPGQLYAEQPEGHLQHRLDPGRRFRDRHHPRDRDCGQRDHAEQHGIGDRHQVGAELHDHGDACRRSCRTAARRRWPTSASARPGLRASYSAAPMTYILTVNNSGTANATNVRVVDTLPAGVSFDSVNGTSLFVCTSGGGIAGDGHL